MGPTARRLPSVGSVVTVHPFVVSIITLAASACPVVAAAQGDTCALARWRVSIGATAGLAGPSPKLEGGTSLSDDYAIHWGSAGSVFGEVGVGTRRLGVRLEAGKSRSRVDYQVFRDTRRLDLESVTPAGHVEVTRFTVGAAFHTAGIRRFCGHASIGPGIYHVAYAGSTARAVGLSATGGFDFALDARTVLVVDFIMDAIGTRGRSPTTAYTTFQMGAQVGLARRF